MKKKFVISGFLLLFSLIFGASVSAQKITLGSVSEKQGFITIPITFTNNKNNVCFIQFDLVLDNSLLDFSAITQGSAIQSFDFSASETEPGRVTVIILPPLQSPLPVLPDGELAKLTAEILHSGLTLIKLENVILTDAAGKGVPPAGMEPPTADAGTDQNVYEGNPVALDGSGSSGPPSGGALSYHWNQISGTEVVLSDPADARPTFTAPYIDKETELLIFELTVGNSNGSDTVSVTITVVNTVPVLSVTPMFQNVPLTSSTMTFEVANTGTGTTGWTATANDSWLTIISGDSGTDSGTVTVSCEANPGKTRIGSVTVTAPDAEKSPRTLEIIQDQVNWITMENSELNDLRGIWGSSETDIFAVGEKGTILHYDGTTWTKMTSNSYNFLKAVWGSSGSNVFAVGEGGTVLHYDGTAWTKMSISTSDDLRGVWGSSGNNVFVVSKEGTVFRYDGKDWTKMTVDMPYPLYDVWGSSSDNVFAVGGTWDSSVMLHYDGNNSGIWTEMAIPGSDTPHSLWGSSGNNVFAAGNSGMVLHYGGRNWQETETGAPEYLRGIWGTSGKNLFAVGMNGAIFQYDGAAWTKMATSTPKDLYGIWGSSETNIFVLGNSGTIFHYYPPVLSVSSEYLEVPATTGTVTFDVSNTGPGPMEWIAGPGTPWLSVDSGSQGTDNGTVTVSYESNKGTPRAGTITIVAPGALNSSRTVEIRQDKVITADIDGSGTTDLGDAILALKILAGMSRKDIYIHADTNKDGKIGMEDVIYILRIVSGL